MSKVKGTDTEGNVVTLEKCRPTQLSLFGQFVPDDDKYSNTIELYDAIPKYFASTKQMKCLREGGKYLDDLNRRFRHKGKDYTITISPARFTDKEGIMKEYYPTEREELVEEALKKLLSDQLNGVFLNNLAGVQFTLYELQQELKRRGHAIHLQKLIQALLICRRAGLTLKTADGTAIFDSAIFPEVILSNRKQWEENPRQTRCYVQFNRLVTHSVNQLTYRQFDYSKFMEHKRQLARWFHKRLSHNYLQAHFTNPYHIALATIVRDSGLVNAMRIRDQRKHVEACLEELKEADVLSAFIKEGTTGKHNKIEDIKYCLHPSSTFVSEVKKANKRDGILIEAGTKMGIKKVLDAEIYD